MTRLPQQGEVDWANPLADALDALQDQIDGLRRMVYILAGWVFLLLVAVVAIVALAVSG